MDDWFMGTKLCFSPSLLLNSNTSFIYVQKSLTSLDSKVNKR